MGFKKGQIVQLKSGGPKMTVETDWGDTVTVVWFAGSKMESKVVDQEAVELYVEAEAKK